MYNEKIDKLDVCTIRNITINSTATNTVENYKSMDDDIIIINYSHSYSLIPVLNYNNDFAEESNTSKITNAEYKKDVVSNVNSSDDYYDDYFDIISEFDELASSNGTYEADDINYGKYVVLEKNVDMTFIKPNIKSLDHANFSECKKEDTTEDYTLSSDNSESEFLIKREELCRMFYERDEEITNVKCLDYSNECFCYYCRYHETIPDCEVYNFLDKYLIFNTNTNIKYLILVFRLRPEIFSNYDVMANKHLRKYILSYLNMGKMPSDDSFSYDPSKKILENINILNQYYLKAERSINTYIFENLFHQPNIKFIDYVKCDSCKNYLCPKHVYLSNCYFGKCKICKIKRWTICGWCKPGFNKVLACKYLH